MNKQTIRSAIHSKNIKVDPTQRLLYESHVAQEIELMAEFRDAHTIALFVALPDEISTLATINRWHAMGKKIALPVIAGEVMHFHAYSPDAMVVGGFNIPSPDTSSPLCQVVPPNEIDLMIVPGVSFTAVGDRLGRGGGYYDRYLSSPDISATTIGICYAHQIAATLPTEPHDIKVDRVIYPTLTD